MRQLNNLVVAKIADVGVAAQPLAEGGHCCSEGGTYAYEGLGSIYWHMVSKLLLATQEEVITRLTEIGVAVYDDKIRFEPTMLRKSELFADFDRRERITRIDVTPKPRLK